MYVLVIFLFWTAVWSFSFLERTDVFGFLLVVFCGAIALSTALFPFGGRKVLGNCVSLPNHCPPFFLYANEIWRTV